MKGFTCSRCFATLSLVSFLLASSSSSLAPDTASFLRRPRFFLFEWNIVIYICKKRIKLHRVGHCFISLFTSRQMPAEMYSKQSKYRWQLAKFLQNEKRKKRDYFLDGNLVKIWHAIRLRWNKYVLPCILQTIKTLFSRLTESQFTHFFQ